MIIALVGYLLFNYSIVWFGGMILIKIDDREQRKNAFFIILSLLVIMHIILLAFILGLVSVYMMPTYYPSMAILAIFSVTISVSFCSLYLARIMDKSEEKDVS